MKSLYVVMYGYNKEGEVVSKDLQICGFSYPIHFKDSVSPSTMEQLSIAFEATTPFITPALIRDDDVWLGPCGWKSYRLNKCGAVRFRKVLWEITE